MATDSSSYRSRLRPSSSYYSSSLHASYTTHVRSATPGTPFPHFRAGGSPYTAVDPYSASITHSIVNLGYSHEESDSSLDDIDVTKHYAASQSAYQHSSIMIPVGESEQYTLSTYIVAFAFDTLPRLLYSYLLLRFPSLYFSRVARIFEDADLTMPEIKQMALQLANQHPDDVHQVLFTNLSNNAPAASPFWNLKSNWEFFIESLLREWKTLNIISVLLLSAILTVLQIEVAANDPLTRYSALLSLICALMSLLYGCIFIIRFGGMRKLHKAAEWAWEARRMKTIIWWNVWVMLAMPAIWLSWSVIAYIICIMSFVWRTGSTLDGGILPLEPRLAVWPRLVISLMLALGLIYFALITATLRQYGSKMDKKWRERVKGWTDMLIFEQPLPEHIGIYRHQHAHWRASVHSTGKRKGSDDSYGKPFIPPSRPYTRSPSPIPAVDDERRPSLHRADSNAGSGSGQDGLVKPVQTYKALDLRFRYGEQRDLPVDMQARHLSPEIWDNFMDETTRAWNEPSLRGGHEMTPQASVLRVISFWNSTMFLRLRIEAVLCQEYYPEWPDSPLYSIYLVDRQLVLGQVMPLEDRFGAVPAGLSRIDILDFSNLQHRWITLFPERDTEVHFNSPAAPSSKFGSQWDFNPQVRMYKDNYSDDHFSNDSDNDGGNDSEDKDCIRAANNTEGSLIDPSRRTHTPSPRSLSSESRRPRSPRPDDEGQ